MLLVPMMLKVLMIVKYLVWLVRSEYSKTKQNEFYTDTSYSTSKHSDNFTELCDEVYNTKIDRKKDRKKER